MLAALSSRGSCQTILWKLPQNCVAVATRYESFAFRCQIGVKKDGGKKEKALLPPSVIKDVPSLLALGTSPRALLTVLCLLLGRTGTMRAGDIFLLLCFCLYLAFIVLGALRGSIEDDAVFDDVLNVAHKRVVVD